MRHALCCLALALALMAAPQLARAESREWSDASGKYKIQAEFVEIDGGVVKLRNAQGKTLSIPLNKLSAADRKLALELAAPAQVADDSAALLNSLVRVIVTLDDPGGAAEGEDGDPEEVTLVGFSLQTGEPGPAIVLSNRNFPRGIDPADVKAALPQARVMALRENTDYGTVGSSAPTDPYAAPVGADPALDARGALDGRGEPMGLPAGAPAGVVGRDGGGDFGEEGADEPRRRFTAAEIANAPLELIVLRAPAGASLPALRLAAAPTAAGAKAIVAKLAAPRTTPGVRPPIPWTAWSVLESDAPQTEFHLQPHDGQYPYIGATLPVLNDQREVVGVLNPGIKTLRDKRRAATAAGLDELRNALTAAGVAMAPPPGQALAGMPEGAMPPGANPLGALFGRLTGALAGAGAPTTPPADPSAIVPPAADPYGRPAMDAGASPPGIAGPVDPHAPWRADYNALASSISSVMNREGRYDIAWGAAADFGAWYDAARQAAVARQEANNSGGRDYSASERASQFEQVAAAALGRLDGVEWTAMVNDVAADASRPSQLAVTPLPEPLRIDFYVDRADAASWERIVPGSTVRFAAQFSVAEGDGEYPAVVVNMTLKEAMAR